MGNLLCASEGSLYCKGPYSFPKVVRILLPVGSAMWSSKFVRGPLLVRVACEAKPNMAIMANLHSTQPLC